MASEKERIAALAKHFGVKPEQVEHDSDYGMGDEPAYAVDGQPGTYSVLTEDEADELCDQTLDSYLDDCVLYEMPQVMQQYFDRAAWKRDALLSDGRAHAISRYDGDEHEVRMVDSAGNTFWLYVYRVS